MLDSSRTPKHIPQSAHQITLSAVSKPALEVIDQLTRAGYQAYLVGGCVRDLLLKQRPKDFDVATSAYPEQVRDLFRRCRLIGRRFRLAHVRVGREMVEVATFRAQSEGSEESEHHQVTEQGQILRDNVYGSIEDDAFRRDFTINALYYDPGTQEVIDYTDGVRHLRERQLLTIGDPATRFREDPVRMLRAVRFAVKLGFELSPAMRSAISASAHLLPHIPASRMMDEVLKLFHNGHALENYRLLRDLNLFRHLFPFTEQCIGEDDENMVVTGLANTDHRVREGKPVIPAFLFACLLWEPLREDVEKLVESGVKSRTAQATAMYDLLNDQSVHVAIPKRIGTVVREIWTLQQRLQHRPKQNIVGLMQHPRFRAAYDFLLMRQALGEVESEIAQWWTRIQEVDHPRRLEMIKALASEPRQGRRRRRRRRKRAA